MNNAPHLPRPSCRIDAPKKMHTLLLLVITIIIGLLAGAVASLYVMSWITPEQNIIFRNINVDHDKHIPEPALYHTINQRIVKLYTSTQAQQSFFASSDMIGYGILLSSDGWITFMGEVDDIETLRAYDHRGSEYRVEQKIEGENGNSYLKLVGNGFFVVSFPVWNTMSVENNQYWSMHADALMPMNFEKQFHSQEDYFLDTDEPIEYIFEKNLASIFDSEGNFIGHTDAGGKLLPSYFMQYDILSLLEKNETASSDFPRIASEYVHAPLHMIEGNKRYGARIQNDMPTLDLQSGDIILSVNGISVDTPHFPMRLFEFENYDISVLRDEELLTITF